MKIVVPYGPDGTYDKYAQTFAIEQGESQMAAYNWLAWDSKVLHWSTGDKPFARIVL